MVGQSLWYVYGAGRGRGATQGERVRQREDYDRLVFGALPTMQCTAVACHGRFLIAYTTLNDGLLTGAEGRRGCL